MLPFSFSLKSSILLIAFVDGLLLVIMCFYQRFIASDRSSGWLGLFLLLSVLYISPFMLGYAGWYGIDGYRESLFYLPLQQLLFLGPVLYFYIRSLTKTPFNLFSFDLLHLAPGAFYLVYALVVVVLDKLIGSMDFYADGRDMDFDPWYQFIGFVSLCLYLLLSWMEYTRYRRRIADELSYADEVAMRWLRVLLGLFAFLSFFRLLFFLLNPEWGEFGSKFWYYLVYSTLFIMIGIAGLWHSVRQSTINMFVPASAPPSPKEISNTSFSEQEILKYKTMIEDSVKGEMLYKDPRLTLSDVAQTVNLPAKTVSFVINVGFAMNFNDYINQHRIDAVIQNLSNSSYSHYSLLGIALDSGFNSKATFNRAFRKVTGQNPTEFLKSRGLKS